jgi:hypothetical protein
MSALKEKYNTPVSEKKSGDDGDYDYDPIALRRVIRNSIACEEGSIKVESKEHLKELLLSRQ